MTRNRRQVVAPLLTESSGFTFLEMMIVVAIIGLLAAIIAPAMIKKYGKSKREVARVQIENFKTALESFKMDMGRYPTKQEGLKALVEPTEDAENWDGPYLGKKKLPKDPWKREYTYNNPGEHDVYDIISYGADGQEGGDGEDTDIVSWE